MCVEVAHTCEWRWCVCVRGRERVCVCVEVAHMCERRWGMCVCERERERERECVSGGGVCVCVCECECVWDGSMWRLGCFSALQG